MFGTRVRDYQKLFTRVSSAELPVGSGEVFLRFSHLFLFACGFQPHVLTLFSAHLPLTGALQRPASLLHIISMKLIDNCRILWHICKTGDRPWRAVSIRPRQDARCTTGHGAELSPVNCPPHQRSLRFQAPRVWSAGPFSKV